MKAGLWNMLWPKGSDGMVWYGMVWCVVVRDGLILSFLVFEGFCTRECNFKHND